MCTLVSSIQYYFASGVLHTLVWPYIRRCISHEMFARVAKERIAEGDKTKTPPVVLIPATQNDAQVTVPNNPTHTLLRGHNNNYKTT